jgi:glycosyltransferase involved in cell wall biosynthesis
VHTHLFKSDFHGRLAARLAGVPVVVSTLHNSDVWARYGPLGALYGATARFADSLIAVSHEVRLHHLRHTGITAQQVITIENGVNVARFLNQEAAGQAVRRELRIAEDAILFGIVGRLKPQKDHATFLRAAAEIHRQLPAARFLVVGDGPLRSELEAQAHELGLDTVLTFTGLRSDIPAILATLDILMFSSLWEGLPVTLLEGMAAALPVVATAVDGIRSVAVSNQTALLVTPGDAVALAAAGLRLGQNPALGKRFGLAGQARVIESFSIQKMIERTHMVYAELLQQRGLGHLIPTGFNIPGGTS